jgi:hypothetical protein
VTVLFYQGDLSAGVSFDAGLTTNADDFSSDTLTRYARRTRVSRATPELLLIATDGELYGHHKPLRQFFLSHLLRIAAPAEGFDVVTPARYLLENPPRREIKLHEPSSWSCHHGVDRWRTSCGCTEGDGHWKSALRRALTTLASRLDELFAERASRLLKDPWLAEEQYILVRLGALARSAFWRRHARQPRLEHARAEALALLEAQYYRHLMFASCAWFFDDLDRIEPRNAIAYGFRALQGLPSDLQTELRGRFAFDLAAARSWRTGRTGADLLQDLFQRHTALPELVAAH